MKKVLRALSLALVIAMLAVTAFADSYVPSIQQKKAMGIKTVTATLEDGTEVKHPATDVVVTPLVDGEKLSEEDQKLLDEAYDSIPEALCSEGCPQAGRNAGGRREQGPQPECG